MDTPPEMPASKTPLGWSFYGLLLAPLVLIAVSFCCVNSSVAVPLLIASGVAIILCSILLAARLAKRMSKDGGGASIGLSIALFFAMLAFYGVSFFIGCTAAVAFS